MPQPPSPRVRLESNVLTLKTELDAMVERNAAQATELDALRERNMSLEKQVAALNAAASSITEASRGGNQLEEASGGSKVREITPSEFPMSEIAWQEHYEKEKFKISQLFPPLTWIPMYLRVLQGRQTEVDDHVMGVLPFSLKGDCIAGLTVGVMLVPQCLAFALLAGMPIQVGLFSSFAPLVAYAAFGTIRQVQPGPTALMSLLSGQALDSMDIDGDAARIAGGALLAAIAGALSVLFGVLRFGFVVDFMSHSVMQAFCSAAGVTIATSQLKHLFGIKMDRKKYWWKTAKHLVTHLHEIDWPTFALGGILLWVLFALKFWKSAGNAAKRKKHPVWRWLPGDGSSSAFKVLKIVADLSSLLCVVIGWLWGWVYRQINVDSVRMVGKVNSDGFTFGVPGDGIMDDISVGSVLVSASIMAIVGFLETMAVGGKFAMAAKYDYDPNQELLALGISNLAGSVMSAYPTTGSFSRTAVNAMLGATSLLSCALSALVVFIAMYALLPVIRYLPLAALAPIIIVGAVGVVSAKDFLVAWRTSKPEFAIMLITFVVSLALTVKEGLASGFVCSVLRTLHDLANPNMAVCGRMPDDTFRDLKNFSEAVQLPNTVVVRMDARLCFFNSRKMKEFCLHAMNVRKKHGDAISFLVIDAKPINHIDLTGAEMLETLCESLQEHEQQLVVASLKTPVLTWLDAANFTHHLRQRRGHVCSDMSQALDIVTKKDARGSCARDHVDGIVERAAKASEQAPRSSPCAIQ